MADSTTDRITVECKCGKRLKAPASAAGKRAKCPACGNVLTITAPPPPAEDDMGLNALYDLADQESKVAEQQAASGSPRCPGCSREMPAGAVLCVNCGYDMRTGSKLKPKTERSTYGDEPAPSNAGG